MNLQTPPPRKERIQPGMRRHKLRETPVRQAFPNSCGVGWALEAYKGFVLAVASRARRENGTLRVPTRETNAADYENCVATS